MRVEEICRACLNRGGVMHNLFEAPNTKTTHSDTFNAVELLELIMQTPVKPDEFTPDKICESCFLEVHRMYLFKMKCEKSQEVLSQLREMKIKRRNELITVPTARKRRKSKENETKYVEILHDPFNLIGFEQLGGKLDEPTEGDPSENDIPLDDIIVKDEGSDTEENQPVKKAATIVSIASTNTVTRTVISANNPEQAKVEVTKQNDESIIPKEENFECPACPYVHTKIEGLTKHMASYHMTGGRCTICDRAIVGSSTDHFKGHITESDFEEMIEAAVIDNEFPCSDGAESFKFPTEQINQTIASHVNPNNFFVETKSENFRAEQESEQKTFQSLPEIDPNSLIGLDNGFFNEIIEEEAHQCMICTMVFDSEYELIGHKSKHIKKDSLNCDICSLTFQTTMALELHIQAVHTSKNPSGQIIFHCTTCSQLFEEFSTLVEHSKQHHNSEPSDDRPHKCPQCFQGFRFEHNLKSHLRYQRCVQKVNGQKSTSQPEFYKCEICRRTFSNKSGYYRHRRSHIVDKNVQCNYCLKQFASQSSVDAHIRQVHRGVKIGNKATFKCEYCPSIYESQLELADHLKSHGVEKKPFQCAVCYQDFENTTDLVVHMSVHPGKYNLKCQYCSEEFTNGTGLATHTYTQHMINETKSVFFECEKCSTVFKSKKECDLHMAMHAKEKLFPCEICSEKFANVQDLIGHTKIVHSKSQPTYSCRLCPHKFRNRADLVRHFREHTGERSFQCETCSESFSDKLRLRAHMVLKHDAKNSVDKPSIKCEFCPRMFMSRQQCEEHMQKHELPYKCEACGKALPNKQTLIEHIQNFHQNNIQQSEQQNVQHQNSQQQQHQQLVWVEQSNAIYENNLLFENLAVNEVFFGNSSQSVGATDAIMEGLIDDSNIEVV